MRAARTAPIRRGDGGVRLWNIATAAPPEWLPLSRSGVRLATLRAQQGLGRPPGSRN